MFEKDHFMCLFLCGMTNVLCDSRYEQQGSLRFLVLLFKKDCSGFVRSPHLLPIASLGLKLELLHFDLGLIAFSRLLP